MSEAQGKPVGMLEEVFAGVRKASAESVAPLVVYEDRDCVHSVVRSGDGVAKVYKYERPWAVPVGMRLGSLDSLARFLKHTVKEHAPNLREGDAFRPLCMVGQHAGRGLGVLCDLTWESNRENRVFMPFLETDEWKALQALRGGVNQKAFWLLWNTILDGVLSPDISGSVLDLVGSVQEETRAVVNRHGLVKGTVSRTVSVNAGGHEVELPTGYRWTGPVWSGVEHVAQVDLHLELAVRDGEVLFTFHAKNLQGVIQDALDAAAEELETQLSLLALAVPVVSGQLG